MHVYHGDIKSANVLVNDNKHAMLCDFGLANLLEDDAFRELATESGFKGTIRWSSPEALMEDRRSTKCDVWSFGWLIWEVRYSSNPYFSQ